jgi:type IV pilus assembly protein PilF
VNITIRIALTVLVAFALVACKGGATGTRGEKSRYAEEQPREFYLNSPAYLNVQLGVEYMKQKEFALAMSKLKKALAYNPDLAVAHTTIAVLYEELGETGLAENHYKRSISLDANDPRLRNNYGQFLCRNGQEQAGIEQFERAASNPLYASPQLPLVNAGSCAMKIQKNAEAETYFRRALEVQPNNRLALLNLMRLSMGQADYPRARSYLQQYTAVGKHSAETLWAGYQIEKTLGDNEAAANYAVRLKSRFPNSPQTTELLKEINVR